MGVGIVAIIPNEKNRTQEELIRKFGCVKMEYRGKKECIPIWKIFEWEGKSYASWYMRPRYVEPERNNPRWEGIRRRLVEVMEYLGAKEVRYSSDVVYGVTPDECCSDIGFLLPHPLKKELLEPPDEDLTPEPIIY